MEDAELVVRFLNTVDLESRTDVLADGGDYRAWCAAHALLPGERERARALRDALRAAVSDPDARPTAPAVALAVELGPGGVSIEARDVEHAVLAAAVRLSVSGRWGQLKICPGDDCGEAFYDRSRNHSRVWCDMAVCGNVAKVRASRRRGRARG